MEDEIIKRINELIEFVTELDKKYENLTIAFNQDKIENAAKFVALSKVFKWSADDVLDFANETKKEVQEMSKKHGLFVIVTT